MLSASILKRLFSVKNKPTLEFSDLKGMAAAAELEALNHNWAVTIAIVDDGGHLPSFLSAPEIKGLLEGGVPIMKDGQCLGAVGVSGVKSSEDAQIARAAIAFLGL